LQALRLLSIQRRQPIPLSPVQRSDERRAGPSTPSYEHEIVIPGGGACGLSP
jgi:hypothetical protein